MGPMERLWRSSRCEGRLRRVVRETRSEWEQESSAERQLPTRHGRRQTHSQRGGGGVVSWGWGNYFFGVEIGGAKSAGVAPSTSRKIFSGRASGCAVAV